MPRQDDPFLRLVATIKVERKTAIIGLTSGQWVGEAEARELVGKISAYTETLQQMKDIAGPGTDYGEEEL